MVTREDGTMSGVVADRKHYHTGRRIGYRMNIQRSDTLYMAVTQRHLRKKYQT